MHCNRASRESDSPPPRAEPGWEKKIILSCKKIIAIMQRCPHFIICYIFNAKCSFPTTTPFCLLSFMKTKRIHFPLWRAHSKRPFMHNMRQIFMINSVLPVDMPKTDIFRIQYCVLWLFIILYCTLHYFYIASYIAYIKSSDDSCLSPAKIKLFLHLNRWWKPN